MSNTIKIDHSIYTKESVLKHRLKNLIYVDMAIFLSYHQNKSVIGLHEINIFFYKKDTKILHRENAPAKIIIICGKNNLSSINFYKDGQYHCYNDMPSIINQQGESFWRNEKSFHREDGPAIIWKNGQKSYFFNNKEFPKIKTDEEWKREVRMMHFEL